MLSTITAALAMGNMNLFQDAMGSEKKSDKYDNSHEYEKSYYFDDENNYRANYNNNYYYQDQQKQQPSYNNNYEGYEDNKKYLIAIVMIMIIANIVIILQKTKDMSVKQDSLKASLSNQSNFVSHITNHQLHQHQ
jgi:hypothetical protein